jgi:UDP-galactopyranose mutase
MRECERSVVTYEYPQPYQQGREAFYPVRDWRSLQIYQRYRRLADEGTTLIGGRLGSYQYFDMHQVVGQAMMAAHRELAQSQPVARAAA